MRPIRFLLLAAMLTAPTAALAESLDGGGALALAALVGQTSPLLGPNPKQLLAKLLDGEVKSTFPPGQTISVTADKLTCKVSNVDITLHSCDLVFGTRIVKLTGRSAHELYATLLGVGVKPDGAAGTVYAAITTLACTIDPNEVRQMSGGGAHCDYVPSN